jgi:predicted short-subunit dehydrogenase-like oxidoreductase (DUF2520 family)
VVRSGKRPARNTNKLARQVKAKVVELDGSEIASGLVWITVPDDAIPAVAAQLAELQSWSGRTVFHSSGALTSDVLFPLREQGAEVASVHPGMTFVQRSVPSLSGVPFGVEGNAGALRLAKKIISDLGGTACVIRKENKVLYHAFDTFASPMLIALMAALESVGREAGIKQMDVRTMAGPLLRQTLANYLAHGAAAAFSGPLIRGDVATIRRHLEALRKTPAAREAYLTLARVAVRELPVKNLAAMKKALRRGHEKENGW